TVVNSGAHSGGPPSLIAAAFSTPEVDVTSAPASVMLTLKIGSDISGIVDVRVQVGIAKQEKMIEIKNPAVDAMGQISIPIDVPQYLAPGDLTIHSFDITDGAGKLGWATSAQPTMAGADIRTAVVHVKNR